MNNMIWANEAGVSVYVRESEHGGCVMEIHRVNAGGYEEVAATATIERHNRKHLADAIRTTQQLEG